MSTETELLCWRTGQTMAERLAAHILMLDGFSSVDPQCPLGGPDGLKDVVCEKNGWKYVGAVYFPPTEQDFDAVKTKFDHDLDGVEKNKADGIVFLTNQRVTPGQRADLEAVAKAREHAALIYHLERLRLILDSPVGFAIRLEYLKIAMSTEEQLSFFSSWHSVFADMLQRHGNDIVAALSKKIDMVARHVVDIPAEVRNLALATQSTASALLDLVPPSNKAQLIIPVSPPPTNELTVETLCALHRTVCYDLGKAQFSGCLRSAKVWIGSAGSTPASASFIPPEPTAVPGLLATLLDEWRSGYADLSGSNDKQRVLDTITLFHHRFVSIHPFLDGNGRMARLLLSAQASELLGLARWIVLEDKAPYLSALSSAHKGDMLPLRRVLTQAILGQEEIAG